MKKTKDKAGNLIKVPVKQRTVGFVDPLEYKIISDKMVNLTKERAYQFLEMQTFSGEREVRDMHVQFLYDEYSAGRFLWHHVILGSAVLDGKEYRINGQHTCWMRINVPESKEPVKADVREIKYVVESSEQLRALYSTFDRNATRSVGHVSTVQLLDTDAARGIPPGYIKNIVAGFRAFWVGTDWRNKTKGINPNELIGIIRQNYGSLFNVVGQFYRDYHNTWVYTRRAAIIGAMFATFDKSVAKAIEFWTPVLSGLNLDEKNDPRNQLRNYIMEHGHSIHGTKASKKVTQEELLCACLNAYNTWREGGKISRVNTPKSGERPKVRT